jgi:transcriptional regulator with XRE-family HTH domain
MDVRDRIRSRLADLGLSVKGASVAAGLGETTLRNYLDGMTVSLTVKTANKLAPVLKASAQWILYGETAEVVQIWERIPADRRQQAIDILETFTGEKAG